MINTAQDTEKKKKTQTFQLYSIRVGLEGCRGGSGWVLGEGSSPRGVVRH